MRHLKSVAVLAAGLLVMGAASAEAQRSVNTGAGAGQGGYWEFGADFTALVFGLDNPSTTTFNFGSGAVRAGRYISDVISIEPRLGIGTSSQTGASSSNVRVEVGVLYHLQSDHAMPQWYVRPNLIFNRASSTVSGVSSSSNRMGLGVGFGYKRPSKKNSRFTWRAEATYTNMLKSGGSPSTSNLALNGGVSVFTR